MRKNKRTKVVGFLLMISFVLTWLSLLYIFYGIGTPVSRKIFSLLLLASPVIIIVIDRPTIFMDLANAILETISLLIMKFFEWVDKYILERKIPKYKRRQMKKERNRR
jgi:hypothetical protein